MSCTSTFGKGVFDVVEKVLYVAHRMLADISEVIFDTNKKIIEIVRKP